MQGRSQKFSGAARVWQDFATEFPGLADDEIFGLDSTSADELRDEYVRLPYDDAPPAQECSW
jgi:hypothetical protein